MAAKILVVRKDDSFSSTMRERGFCVVNLPLIETEPLENLSELDDCLENIDGFDGVFLTSATATKIFLSRARIKNKSFAGRFYVVGRRSADLLKSVGANVFSVGATAERLLKTIPADELKGKRFLFVRGARSLRVIPETLRDVAEVVEAVVYETVAVEPDEHSLNGIKQAFAGGEIRAVCFFSPSGAEEFLRRFESFSPGEIKLAAIGETTARFVESQNLRVDFVAAKPTARDFAFELIEFLEKGF